MNRGFGYRNPDHTYARALSIGPKQLHKLLGHVARAKAQFEEASRGFKSQLAAELDAVHQDGKTDASHDLAGDR